MPVQKNGLITIFFTERDEDYRAFCSFLKDQPQIQKKDEYAAFLEELCEARHPELRMSPARRDETARAFVQEHAKKVPLERCGAWVWYPWLNTIVHVLEETLHDELRTARNKNLITREEQQAFRDCAVAVCGLSVGSHAALTLAMQGGAHHIRLADADTISGTNLNRIRTGVHTAGDNKAVAAAKDMYAMNPYADIVLYDSGLNENNVEAFLCEPEPVRVLVEEMDSLWLKVLIRKIARQKRIPVISAADNGDGIILDVERFDLHPDLPLFGGRIDGIPEDDLRAAKGPAAGAIIAKMIGEADVRERMHASAKEIGKTLYSWPQLGNAAQLAGSALSYTVRMIATNGPLKEGRTVISFEDILSTSQ